MREHAAPPSTPELTLFFKLVKLLFLILLKQKKVYYHSSKTRKNLSHPHGSGPLPDETERHRNDGGSDEDAGEQVDPPS